MNNGEKDNSDMERKEFEQVWNNIINPKCITLKMQYGDLAFTDKSKEEIYLYYQEAVQYAKHHYMMNQNGLLNRYKIGAALIIAILQARPIKKADIRFYTESPDKWIFNEMVALYSGVMIVRNFILDDISGVDLSKLTDDQEILKKLFEPSLPLTIDDRKRWEIELYFLRQEGCYNLLALAHELEDFVQLALLRKKCNNMVIGGKWPL